MIVAATRLFCAWGWTGATLAAVAGEAGTAVETIYSGFGSKTGLLLAATDVAIAGDDHERAVEDRPEFSKLGVGTQSDRLEAAARIITTALERAVPLMKVVQEAAASDAQAAERLASYETTRRTTVGAGLTLILGHVPSDHLVDAMWALASPDVFDKLTAERGWSTESYRSWLVDVSTAILNAQKP